MSVKTFEDGLGYQPYEDQYNTESNNIQIEQNIQVNLTVNNNIVVENDYTNNISLFDVLEKQGDENSDPQYQKQQTTNNLFSNSQKTSKLEVTQLPSVNNQEITTMNEEVDNLISQNFQNEEFKSNQFSQNQTQSQSLSQIPQHSYHQFQQNMTQSAGNKVNIDDKILRNFKANTGSKVFRFIENKIPNSQSNQQIELQNLLNGLEEQRQKHDKKKPNYQYSLKYNMPMLQGTQDWKQAWMHKQYGQLFRSLCLEYFDGGEQSKACQDIDTKKTKVAEERKPYYKRMFEIMKQGAEDPENFNGKYR